MVWCTYVAVCALVWGGNPVGKSSFEGVSSVTRSVVRPAMWMFSAGHIF